MSDRQPTCTSAACTTCQGHDTFSLEHFVERFPLLQRLTSPLVRILAGLVLFGAGLLARGNDSLSLALFLAAYLAVGVGVIIQAVGGISRGRFFTEHFLMSLATIGAFFIGEYAEGFAVMLLYLIGQGLEERAVDRTRRSIDALNRIRPLLAHLATDDGPLDLSPGAIQPGQTILVYPGERIPLDGQIQNEGGSVDYAALTGESRPVAVGQGEEVMAGAVNGSTLLRLTVLCNEEDSALMRIMHLAQEAGSKKTRIELFTERFARIYTPLVVFLAVGIVLFPPLLLNQDFKLWLYRALSFLVISCPCALVISVPLAYIAGIGNASRKGVYIRGSQYLEAMTALDTVVFDKTGTLTDGSFAVRDLVTAPGISKEELAALAAAVEEHSTHPLAQAVRDYAKTLFADQGRQGPPIQVDQVEEIAGHGLAADVQGRQVLAGNEKLMRQYGILPGLLAGEDRPGAVIHLAQDGRWLGALYASDQVRGHADRAIERLRAQGTSNIAILSGDRKEAVDPLGLALGADLMLAGLLPQDKMDELEGLMEKTKGRTAFVGDGINDAPVLRLADVGLAIGGLGSDAAIEAADVVIMTDELERIPDAVSIARKTKRRVYENVILILLAKASLLTLGALGITPLWGAVFADTGVLLLTVLNSLRAYYSKPA